jgi:hypothetical protein
MSNTFQYKQVWTAEYQKSNWSMPVYPVIADLQFTEGLKVGDTVNRRYRSNPIFAKTMASTGAYVVQNYAEANETYTISKLKEASVRIVDAEVLHTDLNVAKSYGSQLANALFQEIDGDTLNAARAGAGTTIDDGSFSGGTSGNGLVINSTNVVEIPTIATEIFTGKSVVYNNNIRFGKLPFEDYGGMLTWIVPPQVQTEIQKYLLSRGTKLGDEVVTNGYRGRFGDFEVFASNNLPYTCRLALSVNPTDGDTITIKGVTLTFKSTVDAGTTAGQVKIASTAALTVTNLVTFLNSSLEADVADATNAGYNGFDSGDTASENGFTVRKSDILHGISATDGTTYLDILIKGAGKVSVSSSFTSGSNGFTAAKQVVHSIIMVGKNVSLAVRKDPSMKENPVSNSVATDHIMWTVYDNKVFRDQARAIIDLAVRCDSSSFTAYSNIHA